MSTQPEALRLAEILDGDYDPEWFYEIGVDECTAELRRLHQVEQAYIEWQDKTEWVQKSAHFSELGMHRADVLTRRIERLHNLNQELLAALCKARKALDMLDPDKPLMYAQTIGLMRLHTDAAIAKADGKAEALIVIGCTNCDNKTSYRLTPTCTECGHDMLVKKGT